MNDLLPVTAHELADELRPLWSRNQLAQDGADRRLKTVPSPGKTQTGEAFVEFSEQRDGRKAAGNEHGVRIQVEHSPDAMDDIKKHPRIFRDDSQTQVRRPGHRLDPEKSDPAIKAENPLEKVLRGGFHLGNRMRLVKP